MPPRATIASDVQAVSLIKPLALSTPARAFRTCSVCSHVSHITIHVLWKVTTDADPTLAGHACTRHTTTKTNGETRKNSITMWQKRRQQAVCAVHRAHAKAPGSWRPLRGRGQLAGRTACVASMRTKMEAWTSSAASCGATEAPAQRRMTRCTMVHELSAPRRAFPTRSRT